MNDHILTLDELEILQAGLHRIVLAALLDMLSAVHWTPFSEGDDTLEIDRETAERILAMIPSGKTDHER